MRSRVMPGSLVTIERRVPVRRLNRVDLPTLGRPTITRLGSFSMFGVDKTLARLQVDALGAAQSRASTFVRSLAALRRQMSASMNRRVLDTIPGIRLTPIRNFRRGC